MRFSVKLEIDYSESDIVTQNKMRNLNDFLLPHKEAVCICEIDGRPYYSEDSYDKISNFTLAVETHPVIHITNDLIHAVSSGEEGRSLFLSVDVPFLKQLTQVYYEHGLIEALHTASTHRHKIISNLAYVTLSVFNIYQRTRLFLNPSLQYKGINTIHEYSQTRNWASHSVRCLAWQPYSCMIAVCTVDDSVRIYTSDNTINYLLRCKQQKNVTCLAWRPHTNGELAVGHEGGIIVWSIDPHSLVVRPSISNAIILYEMNHKPVISLTWSPRGDFLVSAAACDKSIYVWNVELNKNSTLKKPGGSGNVIVKWSPSGDKMFSSTNGIVFRVWDCQTWESEKWMVLAGRVQTACWTNCGTHLLFATSTEPLIYALRVKSGVVFTSDIESSNDQAIPLFDLTKIELDGVCIGGLVQTMEIDPKGNNLAVMFQNTDVIALFNIARKHNIELIASSLITQCGASPTTIAFQQNFEQGACLSIGWSNGKVQHFPIIYTDLSNSLNMSNVNTSMKTSLSYQTFQNL
ncbi:aladin-like [Harmonia axyridis]|uniref:aladin-like n=1 Tax=Harmonia axyridis TaxID=115357 RepID=UPI001E275A7C|nr:aladin-like [Harmonia axyridis]